MDGFSDRPESNKYLLNASLNFTPPAGVSVMTEARKEVGTTGVINTPNFERNHTFSQFPYKVTSVLFSYDRWVTFRWRWIREPATKL
jgi:hypothetical protein